MCAYYDTADKDFHTFTVGMGLPIQGANKVRDTGIRIINILMKHNLIEFFECSATDYLARDFYMFGTKKFETIEQKLLWWYESFDIQHEVPKRYVWIIKVLNLIINFFIRLSPRIAENTWVYWVGGFREVIWKGVKI
jgi:hypothetical protein